MDYTSVLTVILHILILIQVFFSLRRRLFSVFSSRRLLVIKGCSGNKLSCLDLSVLHDLSSFDRRPDFNREQQKKDHKRRGKPTACFASRTFKIQGLHGVTLVQLLLAPDTQSCVSFALN